MQHRIAILLSVFIVAAMILSGCGPMFTPEPRAPGAITTLDAPAPAPAGTCADGSTCVQTSTLPQGSRMNVTYEWNPVAQPTSAVPSQGVAQGRAQCPNPRSMHVGSGISVIFTMTPGFWHINQACPGCGEGIEENWIIRYTGAPVELTLPEGSLWWYRQECFANDTDGLLFRSARESLDDYWPMDLPEWLQIAGVEFLTPPDTFNRQGAPVPTPQVWVTPQAYATPAAPAADPNVPQAATQEFMFDPWNVQGENKSATALGYCSLKSYVKGGRGNAVTLFKATEETTVSGWNGSLTCWPGVPTMGDLGNPTAWISLAKLQNEGVRFSTTCEEYDVS